MDKPINLSKMTTLHGSVLRCRPDKIVILAPSSVKIAERLSRSAVPISAEALGQMLWGGNGGWKEPSGVRVLVHRLRRSLVDVGADVTVKGRRCTGYWFEKIGE
jgi:DNA-binding response OmpR family regulator